MLENNFKVVSSHAVQLVASKLHVKTALYGETLRLRQPIELFGSVFWKEFHTNYWCSNPALVYFSLFNPKSFKTYLVSFPCDLLFDNLFI